MLGDPDEALYDEPRKAAILFISLPGAALWALGLLVGINLIFGGWALIIMALFARGATIHPRGAAPMSP